MRALPKWLRRFLSKWCSQSGRQLRRPSKHLSLEQLEDRMVPAVTSARSSMAPSAFFSDQVSPAIFPSSFAAGAAGNRTDKGTGGTPTPGSQDTPPVDVRSITGAGNNAANRGAAGTDLIRKSPVAFADGIRSASLPNNPSARVVSDVLNSQADPNNPSQDLSTSDGKNLSAFVYAFGQFIDHDMSLTPTNQGATTTIPADRNDPSGMAAQTFARSVIDPTTGKSTSNPAQQLNAVTSFLDLSQVYGSSTVVADALRAHSGGLLKTSPGNLLPYDNLTYFTQDQIHALNMANDARAVPQDQLFAAGDVRANENGELTALQTLFMRNHNRIASQLTQLHPGWTDEQLYQEARKLNIAQYQQIIYTQYLPDLLGKNALPAYNGYNSNTDPSIATEFSTVGFRFGHSLLSSDVERIGNLGQQVAGGSLDLATNFFNPNAITATGAVDPLTGMASTNIGPLLKGSASNTSQASDLMAIGAIRNVLFGNGGLTDNGQDLIARDVQRARDHGIGTYNQVRQAYGLPALTRFDQISSDPSVQAKLQQAYGTVDNIDPFEGGLAENHAPGSDLGPLFTAILADQFTRLRDGDRFFYANQSFTAAELNILQQGNTLAKVITANTDITNLQSDVFVFKASISGTVFSIQGGDQLAAFSPRSLSGVAGVTVQLQDDTGAVIDAAVTDSQGRYNFQLHGTGKYRVRLAAPAGFRQISPNPLTIPITRGDVNVNGILFALAPVQSSAAGG